MKWNSKNVRNRGFLLEKNEENVCNIYANNKRQRCTSICKIHLSLYRYKTQHQCGYLISIIVLSSQNIVTTSWSVFKMFTTIRTTSIFYYFMVLHWFSYPAPSQFSILWTATLCLNGGALCITSLSYSIPSTQLSITVEPVYTHLSNPTPDSTNMHFNISATRLWISPTLWCAPSEHTHACN